MRQKKKIIYIVSDIDKAVFFELTSLLLNPHFELSFLIINGQNSDLAAFLEHHKISVYHVSCTSIRKSLKPILQVKKWLRKQQPDSIHCHLYLANWIGLIAGKLVRVNQRIYTRHSGKPLYINIREKFINRLINYLATDIVAISQNTQNILLKENVRPEKIHLIYHGFDLDRFQHPNPKKVHELTNKYNPEKQFPLIGVIARNVDWKGIYVTLEAFIQLLPQYPQAKIILFGGDFSGKDPSSKIFQKIPQYNKHAVAFEKDIFNLYQLFDIYIHTPVNPSCEAFGQTYVEAIASETPSIFTLSGIAPEIISSKTANSRWSIVPFQDPEAIQSAISKHLNQQVPYPNTGELKRVHEMFSKEKYTESLLPLYQKKANQ